MTTNSIRHQCNAWIFTGCIFSFLLGCKATSTKHEVKMGLHDKWQEQVQDYNANLKGKLTLLPEYHASEYVIVSASMNQYQLLNEYLEFIIQAGAKPLILGTQEHSEIDYTRIDLSQLVFTGHVGTVWVRDYMARTAITDTKDPVFVILRYYEAAQSDQGPLLTLFNTEPFTRFKQAYTPVRSEWGNLVSTDKHLFAVIQSGDEKNIPEKGLSEEFKANLTTELKGLSGLEPVFLDTIFPTDRTGHADMFTLPISATKILVSDLDPLLLEAIWKSDQRVKKNLKDLDKILDHNATIIGNLGYEVIRIPFLIRYQPYLERDPGFGYAPFTNALIVTSSVGKSALFPEYINLNAEAYENIDKLNELIKKSKDMITNIMQHEGYQNIQWVLGDKLLDKAGVIHCSTMQVPKL